MKVLKHVVIFILPIALLWGCETTPEEVGMPEGEAVKVEKPAAEEPGATTRPSEEMTGGAAQRMEMEQPQEKVHPLDDPNSLLATRTIYFNFDQYDIKDEFRNVLTAHAEYLASNPTATVTIEGHTDERGTREYNIALGDKRANAVRQILILQGASASQISTISYGEERPVAMGHNEIAWAQNRRAELVYTSR
jgi:peptidoglycan-associated lipoprotein